MRNRATGWIEIWSRLGGSGIYPIDTGRSRHNSGVVGELKLPSRNNNNHSSQLQPEVDQLSRNCVTLLLYNDEKLSKANGRKDRRASFLIDYEPCLMRAAAS
jgi:hypothetical protein